MAENPELKELLSNGSFKAASSNQKELLLTKFEMASTFAVAGGTFTLTPDFISYVKSLVDDENNSAIIIDRNKNPIKIDNMSEFYDKIRSLYKEAVNEYYFGVESLRKARNTRTLIEG